MQIDKRSCNRIYVPGFVYYSGNEPQNSSGKYEALIVDLSPGGICINTQHEFERGSRVRFYITKYYNGIFTGIVRRCVKGSDDKFHVGLEVPFNSGCNLNKYAVIQNKGT